MFAQALEDELQMLCMLLAAGAGDENIVDVTETEVQTSQNLIHEPLKGLGSIPEAKRHPQKFEQLKWCGDGSLRDVFFFYRDLVVCSDEVDVCEDIGSLEGCCEVLQMWDRIAVRHSCAVECPVIATRTPITW